MHPSIAIVIPTYNERANLQGIVGRVKAVLPESFLVVVDDNSPDGTGDLADSLADQYQGMLVLHRPGKAGIGPAYVAGFNTALTLNTEFVAAMDADGSHSPDDLIRMLEAIPGADLVLGSRYCQGGKTAGWPLYRRMLSRFGGLYARTVLGVPISDLTSGFKLYRRETLDRLPFERIRSDGYGFQIETTWHVSRSGGVVREVPITFLDRVAGKSKLSRRIVVEAMLMVWRLRFQRPA
ncbi:MAG: polyprenol monophosphomannose synthase [Chloroflexota bacterium]|nr:polyprenol monophosphomannose synthase [Chloroflexota bacterium]